MASGLYDASYEHDACGVGMVADLRGRPDHDIVDKGLTVLERLAHRGASGAEVEKAGGAGHEVVTRIFVVPNEDATLARTVARRMITSYLNVNAYAEFHRWLGRGPALQPMWDAWAAGDRKGALAAIPDEVVDDLVVHGSFTACRAKIRRYMDNGVTIPALAIVPIGVDLGEAVAGLSPSAAAS